MLHKRRQRLICGLGAALLLTLAWLYVAPVLRLPPVVSSSISDPLLRSLLVATAASLLSVGLGFAFAAALRNVSPRSFNGQILALFLLPTFMGDLATGFAFKSLAMSGHWFSRVFHDRPPALVLAVIIAIQVWQYGLLCAYLCWMRIAVLEQSVRDFVFLNRLGRAESIRDVFWPHCRSLCLILLLFCFYASANETAKSWLLFKVSPGTRTNLIGHALWEQYQQRIPVSPHFAVNASLPECGFVTTALLVSSLPFVIAAMLIISAIVALCVRVARSFPRAVSRIPYLKHGSSTLLLIACLLAITPFVLPPLLFSLTWSIQWASLLSTVLSAAFGAAIAMPVAIVFGLMMRVASPTHSAGLGIFARIALFLAMALHGVPALAYILIGYKWLLPVADSTTVLWVGWLIGQALLSLPLLGVFAIWIHSRVTQRELDFQLVAGLSLVQVARRSFLERFRLEYAFSLLFAWSLVWHEGALNRVVSDTVPTLVDLLSRNLSARPDFARSTTISMVCLAGALGALFLWSRVQRRATGARA